MRRLFFFLCLFERAVSKGFVFLRLTLLLRFSQICGVVRHNCECNASAHTAAPPAAPFPLLLLCLLSRPIRHRCNGLSCFCVCCVSPAGAPLFLSFACFSSGLLPRFCLRLVLVLVLVLCPPARVFVPFWVTNSVASWLAVLLCCSKTKDSRLAKPRNKKVRDTKLKKKKKVARTKKKHKQENNPPKCPQSRVIVLEIRAPFLNTAPLLHLQMFALPLFFSPAQ